MASMLPDLLSGSPELSTGERTVSVIVGLMIAAAGARPRPNVLLNRRLVRSAMDHLPANQLVGVLMTGMGSDGAQAMTLLRGVRAARQRSLNATDVVIALARNLFSLLPAPHLPQRELQQRQAAWLAFDIIEQ